MPLSPDCLACRTAIAVIVVTGWMGCGFAPRAVPIDSSAVDPDAAFDAAPDATVVTIAASCKELHMLQPSLASGPYTIDPDGSGADPAFTVACDMSTDGGGWTIVFLPTTSDLQGTPIAYTSSTPRLLADATSALLAYRDAGGVAVSAHATFDLPSDWRTDTPFDYANTDLTTNVSIDGGTPALATLRYGNQSFTTTCYDPWITTAGTFGRVCIIGTVAPFYNGFATAGTDSCSDSMSVYAAVACSADFRFSIAVR